MIIEQKFLLDVQLRFKMNFGTSGVMMIGANDRLFFKINLNLFFI